MSKYVPTLYLAERQGKKKGISHLEQQHLTVYEEFIFNCKTCPGCMCSIQETMEEDTVQKERN